MKYNDIRRDSRCVKIKDKIIGGNHDILIQSMTNTDTSNAEATLKQILTLENAGCDIVRITVPTVESASTISKLRESNIKIPIVADIHFDYKVALECEFSECSRYSYLSVFKRLTQNFKCFTSEFGKLVQKQHAVISK